MEKYQVSDEIDVLGRDQAMQMIAGEGKTPQNIDNLISVIRKSDLKHCDNIGKNLLYYIFEYSIKLPVALLEDIIIKSDFNLAGDDLFSPLYIFTKETNNAGWAQDEFEKIFLLLMKQNEEMGAINNLYLIKKDYLQGASQQFWERLLSNGGDAIFYLDDLALSLEIIRKNKSILSFPIKDHVLFLEKLIEASLIDDGIRGAGSFISEINLEDFIPKNTKKIKYKRCMSQVWMGVKNHQYLLDNGIINNYDIFQTLSLEAAYYPKILKTEDEFIEKTGYPINAFKKLLLQYGLNDDNIQALFAPTLNLNKSEIISLIVAKGKERELADWDIWKTYREDPLIAYIDFSIKNKFVYDDEIVDCLLLNSAFIEVKNKEFVINKDYYDEIHKAKNDETEKPKESFLINLVDMVNIRNVINNFILPTANKRKNKL